MNTLEQRIFSLVILVLGIFAAPKLFEQETKKLETVDNFELLDCDGKVHSLSDYDDKRFIVVAFLGTECPLAKRYAKRLQRIHDEFSSDGLQLIAVNSNEQDSLREMRQYLDDHEVDFPFLKDSDHVVADQMGATRNPEVFLLDANRSIRYQGRIDDQYSIGKSLPKPRNEFLKDAIKEVIADKDVTEPLVKAVGCLLGRTQTNGDSEPVTYTNQISRIFQNRCVECHRQGEIGPFSMTSYEDVASWADMIDEVVHDRRMPPWHADPKVGSFSNDRHLTDKELALIRQWVDAGAPEGPKEELPEPKEFVEGWQLPVQPDQIVQMRDKPFSVPAEGIIDYQYFTVDPGFTEDKYVKGFEVIPGNRKVVHHILVFALPPGKAKLGFDEDGFLFAYVPGLRAQMLPEGMAKRIDAGSKLVFQVHYTPIGKRQEDLSSLGMVFADPDEVTHEVYTAASVNDEFVIPPHAADHPVQADSRELPVDCQLLSFSPHMHFRGKRFYYEAVYPDGKREPLMNVPVYDFNWQTNYELSERKTLPANTVIHCKAAFDNSKDNLANPNPNATVYWGEQTYDEMLIGYFTVATPVTANRGGLNPFVRQKIIEELNWLFFYELDGDEDGNLTSEEVGEGIWAFAKVAGIDRDDDAKLSIEEVKRWLGTMDNPLKLLENPLIQQDPSFRELLKQF